MTFCQFLCGREIATMLYHLSRDCGIQQVYNESSTIIAIIVNFKRIHQKFTKFILNDSIIQIKAVTPNVYARPFDVKLGARRPWFLRN